MINLVSAFKKHSSKYPDYSNKTRNEEKANVLFLKLRPNLVIEGSLDFSSEIEREVKHLMEWKAGRRLFKSILKKTHAIKIVEGTASVHDKKTHEIKIKKPEQDQIDYYCSADEEGNAYAMPYPDPSIVLVHEMIHLEDSLLLNPSCSYRYGPLFNPQLDNMNEQITITGLYTPSDSEAIYSPFNESLFLTLMGSSMRVNHLKLTVPENEQPSLSDYVTIHALGSIKHMHGIDVNSPQKMHQCPYLVLQNKMIAPLTAAYAAEDTEIINYLEKQGAKTVVADDIGGPFFGAVYYDRSFLLPKLLEKGVDINSRDNHGNTPLMVAINRNCFSSFEFLLNHKASLELQNSQGETALAIAIKNRLPTFVKMLVQEGAIVPSHLKKEVDKLLEQAKYIFSF